MAPCLSVGSGGSLWGGAGHSDISDPQLFCEITDYHLPETPSVWPLPRLRDLPFQQTCHNTPVLPSISNNEQLLQRKWTCKNLEDPPPHSWNDFTRLTLFTGNAVVFYQHFKNISRVFGKSVTETQLLTSTSPHWRYKLYLNLWVKPSPSSAAEKTPVHSGPSLSGWRSWMNHESGPLRRPTKSATMRRECDGHIDINIASLSRVFATLPHEHDPHSSQTVWAHE